MDADDESYEVALLRGEVERAAIVLDKLARALRDCDVDPNQVPDLESVRAALDHASVEMSASVGRWRARQ